MKLRMNKRDAIPCNEVTETEKEGEKSASGAIEEHGSIAEWHGDKEMEIGGEAEGKGGEKSAHTGGVDMLGKATGNEAP